MDDYISCLDAAKTLKMSPTRFANLLRKERERLPLEINYIVAGQLGEHYRQQRHSFKINNNWAEKIYEESCDMVSYFPILMIHLLDWEPFISGWEEARTSVNPLRDELETAQARIAELESELAACRNIEQTETTSPKAKTSYLTIIAALCNKKQQLDISSRNTVSILKTEIEKIGMTLGDDTIRKIIKEVRDITDK